MKTTLGCYAEKGISLKNAFKDPDVERVFSELADDVKPGLSRLRDLVFDVAAQTEGVGPLEETLKWGQPAYLTPETGSGSTIRLGLPKQGGYAIYTHCRTTILSDFRALFPDDFDYEGNRAIHFKAETTPDLDKLGLLVKHALTYHLR